MSRKPDTAAALAGILKAKRGDDHPAATAPSTDQPATLRIQPPPSPALPVSTPEIEPARPEPIQAKGRGGKSSDKATYSQYSVYLRKDTRKKVGRALDYAETGQDFSELVQELLEQWLASRT
jgi:hypothetical protein